jgi:hypothetical protein
VCTINVNHDSAYLSAPLTTPFFRRPIGEIDMREDSDEKHLHACNVTERYNATERYGGLDEEDDDSGGEEENEDLGQYWYTVRIEVEKKLNDDDGVITEVHEIRDVPRSSISFVNSPYTSDIFLKNSFRHEMMLPDEIFPKAWMNLMP